VVPRVVAFVFVARCGWYAVLGGVARGNIEACSPVAWHSSSRRRPLGAQLVQRDLCIVLPPLLVVNEALVGLLDLVEFVLLLLLQGGIGDLVGVALEDEFAVGGLDGRGIGSLVDAQGLVVVG
jgi:hypothetical protein